MSDAGCTLVSTASCSPDQLQILADAAKSLTETGTLVATALFALLALLLSGYTFWASRRHLSAERVHRLTERLMAMDRTVIDAPGLQKTLYDRALVSEPYFTKERPHDEKYFQLKSFVYMHINFYDEVISLIAKDPSIRRAVEVDEWKKFILFKMRHPMFREIYRSEELWGKEFKIFCAQSATVAGAKGLDEPYTQDEREWF